MKLQFSSFKRLYECYMEMKLSLESNQTIMPKPQVGHSDMRKKWEANEESLCFVADTEKFMATLTFAERNIISLYYENPEATFEWIARWFRINWRTQGFKVERKFFHRQNVCNTFHRVRERGQAYFMGNGYIRRSE